jgi:hypothetical protein
MLVGEKIIAGRNGIARSAVENIMPSLMMWASEYQILSLIRIASD